jgi:hypothetical protein
MDRRAWRRRVLAAFAVYNAVVVIGIVTALAKDELSWVVVSAMLLAIAAGVFAVAWAWRTEPPS